MSHGLLFFFSVIEPHRSIRNFNILPGNLSGNWTFLDWFVQILAPLGQVFLKGDWDFLLIDQQLIWLFKLKRPFSSKPSSCQSEILSSFFFSFHSFNQTTTKSSNVIGHHQPDLSTNRTVYASIKGQLTRHACVSGQNASCARVVAPHFAELTVFVFVFVFNENV